MTTNRRRWISAWLGAAALGGRTASAARRSYTWLLQRQWPLSSRRDALSVGAAWATMTVAFEFDFGHWVDGDSWSALLENYDITAGNIWVLVPLAMATGPELARRLTRSEHSGIRQARTA